MYVIENNFKVFFGNSNSFFNDNLRSHLEESSLGSIDVDKFSDGEIRVEIYDCIKNFDAYIVQSICHPVNDNLMELLLISDALKRAEVSKITAIIPYFGYSRQDRKTGLNTPISAKMIANMIMSSGIDSLITMDLHSEQIGGFFDIPVCNLSFFSAIYDHIKKNFDKKETVIVSPDAGGFKKAVNLSNTFGCDIAFVNKLRPCCNKALSFSLVGNVNDKSVIILDDMVDTAGTLVEAVKIVKKFGPKNITVFCTHPVLSGNSLKRISSSGIENLIVSDSIPVNETFVKTGIVEILSIAEVFADQLKIKKKKLNES